MASGDVQTHMGDKDFLSSQVHTMSKLFSVDAGPRKWIRLWKGNDRTACLITIIGERALKCLS